MQDDAALFEPDVLPTHVGCLAGPAAGEPQEYEKLAPEGRAEAHQRLEVIVRHWLPAVRQLATHAEHRDRIRLDELHFHAPVQNPLQAPDYAAARVFTLPLRMGLEKLQQIDVAELL